MNSGSKKEPKFYRQPAVGDFVWAHFPFAENPGPGPKPRPALVVGIGHMTGDVKKPMVQVAYCTTQKTGEGEKAPWQLVLDKDETIDFKRTGLMSTTKIDLSRIVELPFNDEYFTPPPQPRFGKIPKMGALPEVYISKIKAAYQAFQDRQGKLDFSGSG